MSDAAPLAYASPAVRRATGLTSTATRRPIRRKRIRPSPDTDNEPTRGPLWKKARVEEVTSKVSRSSRIEEVTTKKESSTQNYTHRTTEIWTAMSTKKRGGTSLTTHRTTGRWMEMLKKRAGTSRTPRLTTERWSETLGARQQGMRPSRSRSGCKAPSQGEYWRATARPQAASRKKKARRITKEGCIKVLDCTSMRRYPGGDRDQKEPTSESSSVSHCIKEEDEIDYPTETSGTASQGTRRDPMLSTMSIQDQVASVFEEPFLLTNLSPMDDRFARRILLGTTVTAGGQDVVVLLDSGCEAKLGLSRRFADSHQIQHRPISRVVGVPDGSRISASRTEPISLTIAGSSEEV
jgi:hypothetical protein